MTTVVSMAVSQQQRHTLRRTGAAVVLNSNDSTDTSHPFSLASTDAAAKESGGSGGNSSSSSSGGGACGSADAVVEAGADSTAVLVSDSAGYRVCVEVLVSPRLRRCARVQFWWMAAAVLESVGPCRYSPAQNF